MDFLIGLAVGFVAALLWQRRKQETAAAPPAAADAVAAAPSMVVAALDEPEATDTIAAKLRKLESELEDEAGASAHPRDLVGQKAFTEAVRILEDRAVPVESVRDYAIGGNWLVSCAALAALGKRDDCAEVSDTIVAYFDGLTPWAMHFALIYFLTVPTPRPPLGAPLVKAKEWWRENVVIPTLLKDHFAARAELGDGADFGPAIDSVPATQHAVIKALLERVNHPLAQTLALILDTHESSNIDRAFLTSFGRFWKAPQDLDVLLEPEPWADELKAGEDAARASPMRPLLASGEARVGKTSFLRLLAARLARHGWVVFEASGADLMAGQQWFGQLEGRIQRAIEELSTSKKVIWYIPDILQIAMSGTHQGQAASILDQILPAISAGRLVVWTETSPAGMARLLRLRPSLRGTFEMIRLEPFEAEETQALAERVAERIGHASRIASERGCVETAIASARQFLSAAQLPGSALDLLRLTWRREAKGGKGRVTPSDVIATLSQLTGIPASILDGKERVDLAAVRAYFTERVIGQDEAVSAVVERVAMLKAGLNDPGKPIGVFLFAGPTGTGKTELAKTLAEFLFGSVERLVRLDMSEFQTAESTSKILGSGDPAGVSDSLITLVRKQPFSVVLLDEFEKSHANIWDLFLQVFDDGRLTDQLGQVADFRHCIIILTTNLGATTHRGSGLGFAPGAHAFSADQVQQAVGQTFRPEFQNRLDKVIVFRQLSRDLMRGILKKELSRVLDRRGLKDREWAIEWEASALEFLLEKGFSPEMGARPLKRAIDQYVIAPLAETIVERRFPEGDQFVFVRSDGRAIQAEFVDPDRDAPGVPAAEATERAPALPAIILGATGEAAELAHLAAEGDRVEACLAAPDWEDLKASLADKMSEADFWSRADRHETLSRLALMDRVKAAAGTAQSLRARLDRGTERAGKSSRELIQRLALQLHLVNEGIRDVFEAAPIEVAVLVEPALEKPGEGAEGIAWCETLSGMYRGWSTNRNMAHSDIETGRGTRPSILLVSGFSAYRVLSSEAGLHVLELPDDDEGGPSRVTARVRVAAAPVANLSGERLKRALLDALAAGGASNTVVRRYRAEPAPLVRDMAGGWRSGRLDAVLRGDFDLIAATQD